MSDIQQEITSHTKSQNSLKKQSYHQNQTQNMAKMLEHVNMLRDWIKEEDNMHKQMAI